MRAKELGAGSSAALGVETGMHFRDERQALGMEEGPGVLRRIRPIRTRSGEGRHICRGHSDLGELGRQAGGMLGRMGRPGALAVCEQNSCHNRPCGSGPRGGCIWERGLSP